MDCISGNIGDSDMKTYHVSVIKRTFCNGEWMTTVETHAQLFFFEHQADEAIRHGALLIHEIHAKTTEMNKIMGN